MKQVQNILRLLLLFLFFVKGISLYGQTGLNFSYECEDELKNPVVKILVRNPDKMTSNLLVDTLRSISFSPKNYFKYKGKYILSIWFGTESQGMDSLHYLFNLNGKETVVDISVSFGYKERFIKKDHIFIKGDKVINGYIRLNKYYRAPKTIAIEMDTTDSGNEYYKGPYFKIKNNSKDTLYGEHLPGYFWGTLSYLKNDSVLYTRFGILDYNFVDAPPLYPDSVKYATVGSFGMANKPKPQKYRFEVMLTKKWQSPGIGIYKEQQNFIWWAGTKEYYKLGYDFIVKE